MDIAKTVKPRPGASLAGQLLLAFSKQKLVDLPPMLSVKPLSKHVHRVTPAPKQKGLQTELVLKHRPPTDAAPSRESLVLQHLRSAIEEIATLPVLHAVYEGPFGEALLLQSIPGDNLRPPSREVSIATIKALARLHAPWYDRPDLVVDLRKQFKWLETDPLNHVAVLPNEVEKLCASWTTLWQTNPTAARALDRDDVQLKGSSNGGPKNRGEMIIGMCRVVPDWHGLVKLRTPDVLVHGNAQPSHFISRKDGSIVMLSPSMHVAPGLRDIVQYLLTLMLQSDCDLPFDDGITAYAAELARLDTKWVKEEHDVANGKTMDGRELLIRCSALEAATMLLCKTPEHIASNPELAVRLPWLFSVLDVLTAAIADTLPRL